MLTHGRVVDVEEPRHGRAALPGAPLWCGGALRGPATRIREPRGRAIPRRRPFDEPEGSPGPAVQDAAPCDCALGKLPPHLD